MTVDIKIYLSSIFNSCLCLLAAAWQLDDIKIRQIKITLMHSWMW